MTKYLINIDKLDHDLFSKGWGTQEIKAIIDTLKESKRIEAMTENEIIKNYFSNENDY